MDGNLSLISRTDVKTNLAGGKCFQYQCWKEMESGRPMWVTGHLRNNTHGLPTYVYNPLYTFIWSHMDHTYPHKDARNDDLDVIIPSLG